MNECIKSKVLQKLLLIWQKVFALTVSTYECAVCVIRKDVQR